MFEVIPAIDIKEGKCVRLFKGLSNTAKVYYEDPAEVAVKWESEGAKRIHVVDLDGAFEGLPKNFKVLERIVKSVRIPVQFGGGIREKDTARAIFEVGVDRIILGTVVVKKPQLALELIEEFPQRILVGIDAKEGRVAIKGWVEVSEFSAIELAKRWENLEIAGFVYTDILRDGTLSSPNFNAIEEFAKNVKKPVIASGGVSSKEDIKKLARIPNVSGVIVGKALYEGRIRLTELLS
jgi:phosphoribosylformimino-5-aminoimidazole carboxamide ribotide isomerase